MKMSQLMKESNNDSAIVVGGSLSGLMAAIALAEEGVFVTVLEKEGPQRGFGGGLQVEGGSFLQSKTEKLLHELASHGKSSVQLWGAMEARLKEYADSSPHIKWHEKTRVVEIEQDEERVRAVADSGEVYEADILIGADGHRSEVRKSVSPDRPDARFAGYIVWIASVNEDELSLTKKLPKRGSSVRMLDGGNDGFLFGTVLDLDEISDGRRVGCAWYDNSRNDLLRQLGCIKDGVVHHSLDGEDIPENVLRELIQQAKEKWPEPWGTATAQALQNRSVNGIPVKEYVPDKLTEGRIALIGDAAHVPAPITANGFNQSLKDAVTLGECVAKGLGSKQAYTALKNYENKRLRPVRQMVLSGQGFSRSFGRP